MERTFAALNSKGGVGKTTLLANLGGLLADIGARVLLVDADPQPSLTKYFDLTYEAPQGLVEVVTSGTVSHLCISRTSVPNLDLIRSNDGEAQLQHWLHTREDRRVRLARALNNPYVGDHYDYILIDNASVASAAAFDPLGIYLFVALETSREVAVLDAYKRRQIMRIDVGRAPQGLVASGKRLGGTLSGIDIPSLSDAWATAPYLHDGSAPTLAAAVSAHGSLNLNATDLANVVAYVQQIGSEEGAGWVSCATEGGTCAVPSGVTADVYYGANGTYVMRSGLTGNLACGVASFGGIDPVPGAYKSCAYVPTGTLAKTACGAAGSLCSLPAGTVGDVYYGTGSNYAVRTGVSGAVCRDAFINTNGSATQTCSYVVTATANPPPASTLTACAGESGSCALPAGVTADVYYGANGKYALRTGLTGNVSCNTSTFGGDPTPYVVKTCAYVVSNAVSKTACAAQGAFCALPAGASGDVYYGGGGRFSVRSGVSGIYCNAAQFGFDPNPSATKSCSYVVKP